MKPYDFLKKSEARRRVNPSLWRQAQLNAIHGLFKVTDRIYQVRGFDISNMTIIEGDTGLIVIDPLLTNETAQAGARALPPAPAAASRWSAVIYTHSHADHYGGVRGVDRRGRREGGQGQGDRARGFMEDAVARERHGRHCR